MARSAHSMLNDLAGAARSRKVRCGNVRKGMVRFGRRGELGWCMFGYGMDWQAWQVMFLLGVIWRVLAGKARHGKVWYVTAGQGRHGNKKKEV